jgi:AmiR/NasT family two-component response regulator
MDKALKKIAIADDFPSLVEAFSRACSIHYTIVGKAATGLEAVTLVKALKPQLLLLDLHMPGLNGMEALKQIVPLRTTAVVIMTADADPENVRDAVNSGASGYILKPVEITQIVPALEMAWHAFQTSTTLTQEVARLTDSLETRKILDQAKGILMEQQGMTEEQAHKTLQKMSQNQAISLKEVCRSLIQVRMLLGRSAQRKAV